MKDRTRPHASQQGRPPGIAPVIAAERAFILEDGGATPGLWGLALSGGGIRSATFSLGVLQMLARLDLLRCFHYQSTVSGGGYIGAFVQALIHRQGFKGACDILSRTTQDRLEAAAQPGAHTPLRHLREYSNYLSPKKGAVSGDFIAMVATYARNLVLIQMQICAAILFLSVAAVLLFLVAKRNYGDDTLAVTIYMSTGALAALLVALASLLFLITPGHDRSESQIGVRPRPSVLLVVAEQVFIWTTAAWSLFTSVLLCFSNGNGAIFGWTAGVLYLTLALAWPYFLRKVDRRGGAISRGDNEGNIDEKTHRWRVVLAATAGSIVFGLSIAGTQELLGFADALFKADHVLKAAVIGPMLVVLALALASIINIGLAGRAFTNLQHELLARVFGKSVAAVLLGVSLPLGLTLFLPGALWQLVQPYGRAIGSIGAVGGAMAWLATTGVGLWAGVSKLASDGASKRLLMRAVDAVARLAPWVFVFGLLIALATGGQFLLGLLPDHGSTGRDAYAWTILMVCLAIVVLFGALVDVNEFSLNAFYRNRLVRCYLGASNAQRNPDPSTDFDGSDDIALAAFAKKTQDGYRPLYPLVCATLNLVAAKQLDWQDRKAASFVLSPLFCGYAPPSSHPEDLYVGDLPPSEHGDAVGNSLASKMTLGSAIAISGAAVSPNMGYHSSPAVTFLLTLFNARLGWWVPNGNCTTLRKRTRRQVTTNAPSFFGSLLLAELLGRTQGGGPWVYLSDGGHFENLGLYELVRRRCRFILCVDGSADPDGAFDGLGNAVQKCRVDMGAEIDINVAPLRRTSNSFASQGCAIGRIRYADGETGTLLYLKPVLTGQEHADILCYAHAHPTFPHEPTSDQFFEEDQFESYRRLGEFVAEKALQPSLEHAGFKASSLPCHPLLDAWEKERFLLALERQWTSPMPNAGERFSRNVSEMSRLFAKLRDTPALGVLDTHLYPAWSSVVSGRGAEIVGRPPDTALRMPRRKDFRTCFYFCLDLIHLMESVYHDLALEKYWDHPDNRGWVNAFRQWSWSPMVRIAWTLGAPSLGTRFTAFCETRLNMPRFSGDVDGVIGVESLGSQDAEWPAHCETLRRQGLINAVEKSVLCALPFAYPGRGRPRLKLFRLYIEWDKVLVRSDLVRLRTPRTTLGIAALNGRTLNIFRIQDHVRCMGLGGAFMRLLNKATDIKDVEIFGDVEYGLVGRVTKEQADVSKRDVERLLRRVRSGE